MAFTTSLVGMIRETRAPSAPLYTWTWTSTYNGETGGVQGLTNFGTPTPGTGAGYVTITSINGVSAPPIVPPSQVSTTASGLAYSRVTQTFNGAVTITNLSGSTNVTPTS